jgi:hypothetical protein
MGGPLAVLSLSFSFESNNETIPIAPINPNDSYMTVDENDFPAVPLTVGPENSEQNKQRWLLMINRKL